MVAAVISFRPVSCCKMRWIDVTCVQETLETPDTFVSVNFPILDYLDIPHNMRSQ